MNLLLENGIITEGYSNIKSGKCIKQEDCEDTFFWKKYTAVFHQHYTLTSDFLPSTDRVRALSRAFPCVQVPVELWQCEDPQNADVIPQILATQIRIRKGLQDESEFKGSSHGGKAF